MQTFLALLFFVALANVVVALVQRYRARRAGAAFDSRRLKIAGALAIALPFVGAATDGDQIPEKPNEPAAVTAPSTSPRLTTPPTTPGTSPKMLAALQTAEREKKQAQRRRAAAARKKANRAKARVERRVSQRKAANRAKARAANATRAAAAVPDAQPEPDASPAADYSGMTCPEIGHSFTVPPGSDPDHDADGDGLACESQ